MTSLTGNCDIEFELPKEVHFSFFAVFGLKRK